MDYFLFNFSGVQFHYTMSQNLRNKDLSTPERYILGVLEYSLNWIFGVSSVYGYI